MKQIRSEDLGDVTDYFESIQFSVFSQERPLNGQIENPPWKYPCKGIGSSMMGPLLALYRLEFRSQMPIHPGMRPLFQIALDIPGPF